MIGETFGHFRILSLLGSGGMGVVYRAHDEKLQRTVAIKVVGRESGASANDRVRIVEEARAASGLSHPHICTVYETGDIDGQAYIAMEFVDGRRSPNPFLSGDSRSKRSSGTAFRSRTRSRTRTSAA